MDALFGGLAHFVVRFRWLVVVFWLAVAVVVSATLPSLASEVNDNNSAFLPASAASNKAANLATPLLGGGANGKISVITIVGSRNGGLTAADLAAVGREAVVAHTVQRVKSVDFVGISADGQAAQLRVRVQLSSSDIVKDKAIVDDLHGTFARANAPPGLQLHLAGQIATLIDNQASSNKAGNKIQAFSFLFIIVLLLLVFRSLPAAIVTLLPSGLALVISGRLIGALGAGGLSISSITQELLIVLLLGAGTDYGLFLVFRVREELRNGLEPRDAVVRALVRVGESITASAGTVILALLTLLLASFGLYKDLGVPLAVGVAVMLLLGLTLLPALLAILGRKAFWPSRTAAGTQRDGAWGKVAARLVQRPKTTLADRPRVLPGAVCGCAVLPVRWLWRLDPGAGRFGRRRGQRGDDQALPGDRRQPCQPRAGLRDLGVQQPAAVADRGGVAAHQRPVHTARRAAAAQRHEARPRSADAPAYAARSAAVAARARTGRAARAPAADDLQRIPRVRRVRVHRRTHRPVPRRADRWPAELDCER